MLYIVSILLVFTHVLRGFIWLAGGIYLIYQDHTGIGWLTGIGFMVCCMLFEKFQSHGSAFAIALGAKHGKLWLEATLILALCLLGGTILVYTNVLHTIKYPLLGLVTFWHLSTIPLVECHTFNLMRHDEGGPYYTLASWLLFLAGIFTIWLGIHIVTDLP